MGTALCNITETVFFMKKLLQNSYLDPIVIKNSQKMPLSKKGTCATSSVLLSGYDIQLLSEIVILSEKGEVLDVHCNLRCAAGDGVNAHVAHGGTPSEAVVLVDLLCLLVDGDLATVLHNDVGGARLRALASAIQARAIVHRHLGCLDLLVPRDQRLLRGVVEEGLREARGSEASGVVRVLRWDRPM